MTRRNSSSMRKGWQMKEEGFGEEDKAEECKGGTKEEEGIPEEKAGRDKSGREEVQGRRSRN